MEDMFGEVYGVKVWGGGGGVVGLLGRMEIGG